MKTLKESILDTDFDIEMPELKTKEDKELFKILSSKEWKPCGASKYSKEGISCPWSQDVFIRLQNLFLAHGQRFSAFNKSIAVWINNYTTRPYIHLMSFIGGKSYDHIEIINFTSGPTMSYDEDTYDDGHNIPNRPIYVPVSFFKILRWFYKTQRQ